MCTTSQVLYVCSHQATHRFRTGVCRNANSARCNIHDETEVLSIPCRNCAALTGNRRRRRGDGHHDSSQQQCALPKRLLHATWHVPSRCFVNIGFQTLDPFGVGVYQGDPAETAGRSQRAEISPFATHMQLVASRSPVQTDRSRRRKFVEGPENWRPSWCCRRETRGGAYEATRLEGPEQRIEGRIMDSLCESSV